jgi:hypothetical protein
MNLAGDHKADHFTQTNGPIDGRSTAQREKIVRAHCFEFDRTSFYADIVSLPINEHVTYGLSSLGEQTGRLLPAAFLDVESVLDSPFYAYAGGVTVLVVFALVLGVLTTVAEPGMLVIGRKIETITHGHFRANALVLLVASGVAIGMTIGIVRLAFAVTFIAVLVPLYGIALLLTLLSSEDIVNIAWDLAGMTTGPVTVPFVLALGLNIARGVGGEGGFGILALSSICPVITVLGYSVAVRFRA